MLCFRFFAALLVAVAASRPAAADAPCAAPQPVCEAAASVFAISSFDPLASAVLIEPGLLVTNRHAVADNARAEVMQSDGRTLVATVVPSAYAGDLILLRAPQIVAKRRLTTAVAGPESVLYTIGADVGRQAVRVYKPGRMLLRSAEGKPFARVHHDAYGQPGNSGGALVDELGRLVGIIASGGSGRHEAIPSWAIADLRAQSGPEHLGTSQRIGIAHRKCSEALDAAQATREQLGPSHVAFIKEQCEQSGNRQLWDLAGQVFGRQRLFDDSLAMFQRSLDQDPNAVNSMLSLAITLHLAQRYADEVPHLKRLVEILPADAEVLRLGVQAGAWGGDKALTEKSLALLTEHHPKMAPLARDFIEKNPTPPARRPPGNAPPGR
jgi:hypothetical protein